MARYDKKNIFPDYVMDYTIYLTKYNIFMSFIIIAFIQIFCVDILPVYYLSNDSKTTFTPKSVCCIIENGF